MSQTVPHLDAVQFDELLASSPSPVLIDFTASWCPPCKLMAPILDELAAERGDSLVVEKVDVDDQPELAARYAVQSMPTMVVIRDSKEVARFVGARPKHKLEADLEPWIAKECVDC